MGKDDVGQVMKAVEDGTEAQETKIITQIYSTDPRTMQKQGSVRVQLTSNETSRSLKIQKPSISERMTLHQVNSAIGRLETTDKDSTIFHAIPLAIDQFSRPSELH